MNYSQFMYNIRKLITDISSNTDISYQKQLVIYACKTSSYMFFTVEVWLKKPYSTDW